LRLDRSRILCLNGVAAYLVFVAPGLIAESIPDGKRSRNWKHISCIDATQ
jgi:hypothetical protein